jgi:CO dehydrogenase/acetyl-CoA synthase delta subunit
MSPARPSHRTLAAASIFGTITCCCRAIYTEIAPALSPASFAVRIASAFARSRFDSSLIELVGKVRDVLIGSVEATDQRGETVLAKGKLIGEMTGLGSKPLLVFELFLFPISALPAKPPIVPTQMMPKPPTMNQTGNPRF